MTAKRLPPAFWAAAAVGIALIWAAANVIFIKQMAGMGEPVRLAITGFVVLISFFFAFRQWRLLDEPSRAAQVWAWAKGGQVGLVIAMVVAVAVVEAPGLAQPMHQLVDRSHGRLDPEALGFALGVISAGMLQVVGFGLAWLIWWGRKLG